MQGEFGYRLVLASLGPAVGMSASTETAWTSPSASADLGWSPSLFAVMAAGLGLLALMWPLERWVEHHRKVYPWFISPYFRTGASRPVSLPVFFFTFANISFYLVITLYMQLGLHFSPLQSGSVVLPLAIGFAVMSRLAGPRAQRRGVTALLEGCGIQIVGLAILGGAVAICDLSAPPALALLLVVFGVGQAMVMAPLYGLVLTKVPAAHAGSGGGVMITVQQIGNAAGVAVIGTLYYSIQAAHSARYALLASLGCLAISIGLSAGLLRVLDRAPSGQLTHFYGKKAALDTESQRVHDDSRVDRFRSQPSRKPKVKLHS